MTTKDSILETLRLHKPELVTLGVKQVGLFGSYVRNEQSPSSDIDLLLDFEPNQERFDNYMQVCDLLEELFQDQKVEVVTKNGLSPHIGPRILKEVVYV